MKHLGWFLVLCLGIPSVAQCLSVPDRAASEVGKAIGIDDTLLVRGELVWSWPKELIHGTRSALVGYWELSLGAWNGDRTIVDVGLTPVFRWESRVPLALGLPYLEGAVGAHLISDVCMYERCFSTAFQFGDHIGLGTRFGSDSRFEFSYRLQHLSNGGIKDPNSGILFNILRFAFTF